MVETTQVSGPTAGTGHRGPTIGVLALQGDFEAHARALRAAGATPLFVRHPAELDHVQGLILPGGESTTTIKFLERGDFFAAIRRAADQGMPVFGTCAGAILMAGDVSNTKQPSLGLLDIAIRRNAYGRQLSSFITAETCAVFPGEPLEMVFIRAPIIERTGHGVTVLVECRGKAVLVRQGRRLAATFHPELTADLRVHRYFLDMVMPLRASR
jgi:pyridoxal 5'-phosphate synthase pdxT subunit